MRLKEMRQTGDLRLHEAQELIREALKRILLDPDWIRKINGKDRERYLNGLL